jgi:hypothetical protein
MSWLRRCWRRLSNAHLIEVTPMRGLFKVILVVATIVLSALLIQHSCQKDPGRPDPYRPGGVAMVTQPPAVNTAPSIAPTSGIVQDAPRVASKARTPTVRARRERTEAHGDEVAAVPAATPGPKPAKADDDIIKTSTARTTAARSARRTVARTRTVRRKEQQRIEAGVKASRRVEAKPMND